MEHLRAKVGQLDSLVVLERRDGVRLGHNPRVRSVHAVDVLPHGDPRRTHQPCKDRRGVVRARALERGGRAFCGARDEAGHDHDGRPARAVCVAQVRSLRRQEPIDHLCGGDVPQRVGADGVGGALVAQAASCRLLYDEHVARVEPSRRHALRLQVRLHRHCRPDFSVAGHHFHRRRGDAAQQRHRAHDADESLRVPSHLRAHPLGDLVASEDAHRFDLLRRNRLEQLGRLVDIPERCLDSLDEPIGDAAPCTHNRHRRHAGTELFLLPA
mmetsp:Transcript_25736/g.60073  ORF Transcript_25736/g.60073 Transcript_25736/m.60073 type:complete len:270 (+) Transcript_25736:1874-2683(+)